MIPPGACLTCGGSRYVFIEHHIEGGWTHQILDCPTCTTNTPTTKENQP